MQKLIPSFFLLFAISSFGLTNARADYSQRLSVSAGIATFHNSNTQFELGAEYEYRLNALLGIGGFGNYIFSTPGITLIGVPEIFVHPLLGELLVSAAPLFEFGAPGGTHVGTRLGARLPLPLGLLTLTPSFAVDFIGGGNDYIIGLGIGF